MLAVELKFESKSTGAPERKTDAITWLLAAFVRNGNLLEDFLVECGSGGWLAYGIAPARDAFRKSNWNKFVQQRIDGLSVANLRRPQIRFLGVVPETAPACRCVKPKGFFLFTTFLHVEPPLRCMDCNWTCPLF